MGRVTAVRDITDDCVNGFDQGMHALEFISTLADILTSDTSADHVTIANMVSNKLKGYIIKYKCKRVHVNLYRSLYSLDD